VWRKAASLAVISLHVLRSLSHGPRVASVFVFGQPHKMSRAYVSELRELLVVEEAASAVEVI
jgi:hypothetical protein